MAEKRTISFDEKSFRQLELIRKYYVYKNSNFTRSECVRSLINDAYQFLSCDVEFNEFVKGVF